MVITMQPGASPEQIKSVTARVEHDGFKTHLVQGTERTIVCVLGDDRPMDPRAYEVLDGVEKTTRILKPFKLTSREAQRENSKVTFGGVQVGDTNVVIIAGPCSVESHAQLMETAHAVKDAGAQALRGGAFKPRSSPYSFQGLGEEGLHILAEARDQTGLPIVTEVMASQQVPLVAEYADVLQVGARNMQNRAPGLHDFQISTRTNYAIQNYVLNVKILMKMIYVMKKMIVFQTWEEMAVV